MTVSIRNRQRLLKIDARRLKRLAQEALTMSGATGDCLHVVLVDDRAMARLNERFHGVRHPTDVLAFDYTSTVNGGRGAGRASLAADEPPPDETPTGEVVVSAERAAAQAKRFHSIPERELLLYIVHGILHLHGFDDLTPPTRRRMRAAERRIMSRLRRRALLRFVDTSLGVD